MSLFQDKNLNQPTLYTLQIYQTNYIEFSPFDNENSLDLVLSECQKGIDFFSESLKEDNSLQSLPLEHLDQLISIKKSKHKGCHCKKTKCMKMYCQCLAQGLKCNSDCVCIDCQNDDKHQKDSPENTEIFNIGVPKIKQMRVSGSEKGCNCKKSHCQKRYCQCLNAGKMCTQKCQCIECNNCMILCQHQQKYKSSSVTIKKSQNDNTYQNQSEQTLKLDGQDPIRKQFINLIVSSELLAEIDGYINN